MPADIISNKTARILVIDDEKITRITLAKVLKKSGYEIIEASNGEQGIGLCLTESPDLVLLDVIMPGIDGYETCRKIRESFDHEKLPIIMLTGLNDIDSVDNAFNAGATDFITKPVNWSLLSQRVRYSIRARELYNEIRKGQARISQAQLIARMGYWDMVAGTDTVYCSDELLNVLEINHREKNSRTSDFLNIVHPDDKNDVFIHVQDAVNDQRSSQFEHRIIRGDGEIIHVLHKIEVMHDATNGGTIIGIVQDITEHKDAEALISFQRNYDSLTGLPNKSSFVTELENIVSQPVMVNTINGIFFVGVDKLTSLTNTLGHVAGDTLIQMIAERIETLKDDGYFVTRYSDDVFSVISPEMHRIEEISEIAKKIMNLCENIYNINDEEIHSRISVGVSIFPVDNDDVDTLIKGAESAMHRARKAGGNEYRYYSEKINRQAQERLRLEKDMRNGLNNDEFIVYYQPQVDLKSGNIVGMEALARWQHPEKGLVSPFDFIPVAEETGLIIKLGSIILHQACKQAKEWQDEGLGNLRVGVNLSPRQFISHDLVAEVNKVLADTHLPPESLDLEITESMAVNNLEVVVNSLTAFKKVGITVSMDDFGTGYSALSMLQKLPLDILKIDRSFIMNIGNGDNGAIAGAIIAMSHSLGLSVIAEGVETEDQLDFVRGYACNEIQGFYYSPPLPADKFREYVIKHNQIALEKAI